MGKYDFLNGIGTEKGSATDGEFPLLYKVLTNFGERITDELLKSIHEKGLDESGGNLGQSINFDIKILGSGYHFTLLMSDYYEWVDKGRKAGKMPPIAPILAWVQKKGIRPLLEAKKRKASKRSNLDRDKEMAYGIAMAIAKKGTIKRFGYKGSRFYSDVINDSLITELTAALSKAAKQDVLVQLKSFGN